MKIKVLAFAGLAAASFAGAANANNMNATVVDLGEVVAGFTTYQVRADGAGLGGLVAIGQAGDGAVLQYNGGELWNAPDFPDGFQDFWNAFSPAGDSWITLGAQNFGQWTPGYDTGAVIVQGTSWGGLMGEGAFNANPPSAIVDGGSGVLIAQFTVATGEGFTFGGTSAWLAPGAGTINRDFFVEVGVIPAPGALALLGLAGLAGRRRRA